MFVFLFLCPPAVRTTSRGTPFVQGSVKGKGSLASSDCHDVLSGAVFYRNWHKRPLPFFFRPPENFVLVAGFIFVSLRRVALRCATAD
jgi:hypothetical protein